MNARLLMSEYCRQLGLRALMPAVLFGGIFAANSALAQERYFPGDIAQPAAKTDKTSESAVPGVASNPVSPPPATSPSAPATFPFEDNTASPAKGTGSGPLSPLGGPSNPYRNSPIGTAQEPRTLPMIGGDNAPAASNLDSQPKRTAYEVSPPPAAGPPPTGTEMKPSAMMRAMMVVPAGSQLRGQPLTLMEVLSSARNRAEQSQRIDAYWDLCSSVADYYLGLREQDELRNLSRQRPGAVLQKAESELNIRVGTSQKRALASQLRLASVMGRSSNNLPLPADTPHCASYATHYEEIFQGGGPVEAVELARLLPLQYVELQAASFGVTGAEGWLDGVARNDSDGSGTVRALELLALRRRAFVQIARDYNRRISRYSELASPGQISANRLTSMLINTGASSTATKSASPAPPPRRNSSSQTTPPPTFAAGSPPAASANTDAEKRDDAVQQASATERSSDLGSPRREHSLLVP